MPLVIRRATPEDAGALAELARRVFFDTFASSTPEDDMKTFLASAYGEERQRSEIVDPAIVTLLADAGELVGYAQLRRGGANPAVTGPEPLEIVRFYVEKTYHGRGVAQRLMGEVESEARALGAGTLWLGVWERNHRALAFYRKYGFDVVGSVPFAVGTDVQTDLVLARSFDGEEGLTPPV